ncbi:predicted protein [Histoplasma mississippiense (nom. inval.)]|uniref:predicted protein n=1 Tax=Ajellomyces capsulatus (strain NAm1 / WU24) TaxID=2059318 RepID=UPI000157CB9B|nr:predicted protein [Histoplasma mississippiense (nom. inval.)]EDN10495.1 predicted protein [Histoplasma mississippiense (nom. inval.)]
MPSSLRVGEVLDIGGSGLGDSLKVKLKEDFISSDGKSSRSFPTELFYYGLGLQLWNQVCWLADYHQTRDEISLLECHGAAICEEIPLGCTIVDMGSGDIRKPACLLQQLESLRIPVSYFALDISRDALEESMTYLANRYQHVKCYGLWGTFEDGRQWLRSVDTPKRPRGTGKNVSRIRWCLGKLHPQWFSYSTISWKRLAQTEERGLMGVSVRDSPHKFSLLATKDVDCPDLGLHVGEGEVIEFFGSWKYGPDIMKMQFEQSGMMLKGWWASPLGEFYQYLISCA